MTPRNLPDPTMSTADWLAAIKDEQPFTLRDFRSLGEAQTPKSGRLWTISAGVQINYGLNLGIITVERRMTDGQMVSHGSMAAEARQFWNESLANGMSPEDVLTAWKKAHVSEEVSKHADEIVAQWREEFRTIKEEMNK